MTVFRSVRRALVVATACACCIAPAVQGHTLDTYGFANGSEAFDLTTPTVSASTGGFAGAWDGTPITFWCVELTQYFTPGSSYMDYSTGALSGSVWSNLGRLFSEVDPATRTSTTDNSAAFQLAIWEIVYEGGTGLDLTTGTFHITNNNGNTAAQNLANTWLTNLPGSSVVALTLLHSDNEQDFITVLPGDRDCCTTVPEPSPLPLAALGLLAMVAARRRTRA